MNPQLTKLIADLRDETDSPNKSDPQWGHRNRIFASMLEQLNNEGLGAYVTECQTIIGGMYITLHHTGANAAQIHRLITAWSQAYLKLDENE